MQTRIQLEQLVDEALAAAVVDGTLTLEEVPSAALERPRDLANGDWASTVALRSAKLAHCAPRQVAEAVLAHLPENALLASAEIAGPGFINFRLSNAALQDVVVQVRAAGAGFGKSSEGASAGRINLEYVSANPTGPMHVGHGRWAALGSSMARIMRHAGYRVSEEFYINDHGVQLDVFGASVSVRYRQLLGQNCEMPENCYGGSYVADIAQSIIDADGGKWLDVSEEERKDAFKEIAYKQMLTLMRETLERFGVQFDTWFSERSLYVVGADGTSAVSRALAYMEEKGCIFQKDGATWFKSTAYGDDKDRVLIKENGEYTYFMSDVAYHYDKLQRGFAHLLNIWGADHHGYVKRCEAMLEAWGYPNTLEIVLGQLVNLFRDGEAVRMSKRTGEMVTFAELIDEVGTDATRFLMLCRSSDQQIDFDIEAAKRQDASNPVYYVQYAHARICSICARAQLDAQVLDAADLSLLSHESELALMRKMDEFTDLVAGAARDRAPFRLTHYAQELAGLFHQFYTNCHVICDNAELQAARLALCGATRTVLAVALDLLGVSAPEHM